MTNRYRSLAAAAFGAALLCAGIAARAQDNVIGPAPLKDFQLTPRERIVSQPAPQAAPPVEIAPPAPVAARPPAPARAGSAPSRPAAGQPEPRQQAPAARVAPPQTPSSEPAPAAPIAAADPELAPVPAERSGDGFPWLYAIPAAAFAFLGLVLLRRRGRSEEDEPEVQAPVAAPAPTAEPAQRPWLELALKAERASATPTETVVNFELRIANIGKAAARNLRIDVKMFNAGREQDKEIGAFFRTAGRESTKCHLPGIAPDTTGVIQGEVAMPRDDMRAVRLDDKLLFIPMIAVNALYDWGEGRTGQTSRSYVVGRELQEPSEKMGAFRVDQGPRIWRTSASASTSWRGGSEDQAANASSSIE